MLSRDLPSDTTTMAESWFIGDSSDTNITLTPGVTSKSSHWLSSITGRLRGRRIFLRSTSEA